MTVRQKKLYNNMNKKEQDMFDYLVHVEDRKIDDGFFFLHSTFQPSRDDFKKPSFANLNQQNKLLILVKELETERRLMFHLIYTRSNTEYYKGDDTFESNYTLQKYSIF